MTSRPEKGTAGHGQITGGGGYTEGERHQDFGIRERSRYVPLQVPVLRRFGRGGKPDEDGVSPNQDREGSGEPCTVTASGASRSPAR